MIQFKVIINLMEDDNRRKTVKVGITNFIDNGKIGIAYKSKETLYSSYGIELDTSSNSKSITLLDNFTSKQTNNKKIINEKNEIQVKKKSIYIFHYLIHDERAIAFFFDGMIIRTPFLALDTIGSFIKRVFRKFVSIISGNGKVYSAIIDNEEESNLTAFETIKRFISTVNNIKGDDFQLSIDATNELDYDSFEIKNLECSCIKKRKLKEKYIDIFISDEVDNLIESIISKRNETYKVNKLITAKRTYLSHNQIIKSIESMLGMLCEHIRAYYKYNKYEEIFYKFINSVYKPDDLSKICVSFFYIAPFKTSYKDSNIFKFRNESFKKIIDSHLVRYENLVEKLKPMEPESILIDQKRSFDQKSPFDEIYPKIEDKTYKLRVGFTLDILQKINGSNISKELMASMLKNYTPSVMFDKNDDYTMYLQHLYFSSIVNHIIDVGAIQLLSYLDTRNLSITLDNYPLLYIDEVLKISNDSAEDELYVLKTKFQGTFDRNNYELRLFSHFVTSNMLFFSEDEKEKYIKGVKKILSDLKLYKGPFLVSNDFRKIADFIKTRLKIVTSNAEKIFKETISLNLDNLFTNSYKEIEPIEDNDYINQTIDINIQGSTSNSSFSFYKEGADKKDVNDLLKKITEQIFSITLLQAKQDLSSDNIFDLFNLLNNLSVFPVCEFLLTKLESELFIAITVMVLSKELNFIK